MVHEGKIPSPKQALERAITLLKLHQKMKQKPEMRARLPIGWEKPSPGVLKLNVDGAIFNDQQGAGVGIILRDAVGEVLLAVSKKGHAVNDPPDVELLAMLRGLQLCIPLGIEELILESDSLLMITQLQEKEESWSLLGNIIKETKLLMARFYCCTIQHVGCKGNEAAHSLARYAWHIDDISILWESFPKVIQQIVWVDKFL
ncbi:hypothetical protein F2P56_035733 [Juglans regia]|uniref:Uncharacterized protein LOC108986765 n=2 Tax=Juglans regia TaxID=51240 RepID=A0A2I4E6M4_JUGRE|nr:uncharacterized protein LOC108986765 [Juglans regia]KAF5443149.1 hypothetical protein F2P56_035733 [Juglans regia]